MLQLAIGPFQVLLIWFLPLALVVVLGYYIGFHRGKRKK